MKSTKAAVAAATLVLAGCYLCAGVAVADPVNPVNPVSPAEPKTSIDQDGTYVVGTGIVPGVYASAGPVEGGACYWKREGGPDERHIIDSAMSKKPQVVQIDPTDKAFKTHGCQPWQRTVDASVEGAEGNISDDVAAMLARAKLQAYLDELNARALQSPGAGQVPGP